MKKAVAFVLLFACLLFSIGCTGAQELQKVELHEVTRSVFYAPQYVAISKGFFEEEGLEINVTTSGGSDKAMSALLSGQADICLAGPETGVYVVNEGKADHPIIVGQLTKRDGSYLIGRQPEPNFDWKSLKGKTIIGGRAGGMPLMTLQYVLKSHGLVPGVDVEVIDSIQFNLMGGQFGIDFFLPAMADLKIFKSRPHSTENKFLKFRFTDFTTARAAFIFSPFTTAKIAFAVRNVCCL